MNYYVVSDETRTKFLRGDGSWTDEMNDAEHMTIEQAVEKQVELIRREVITEICEVPLMHESFYDDVHSRIDDLQAALDSIGITLSTEIGQGDETTWTLEFPAIGRTVRIKLDSPDSWEVTDEN